MDNITLKILSFLEEELPKQNVLVAESGPMNLISQVNWAIQMTNSPGDAWDIAKEIYRHFHANDE